MAETYFNCPHCKQQIKVSTASQGATWQSHSMSPSHTFQSVTPWNGPSMSHDTPGEWERKTPYRPPSVAHDVLPALAAAGVSGALALACSLTASALSDWPWWAAVPCGLGLAVVTWYGSSHLATSTLYQVERFVTHVAEEPLAGESHPMSVTVQVKEAQHWQFEEIPIEPVLLHQISAAVLGGDPFAERTAASIGMTQEQFKTLRDIFVKRGWATWRHPNRKQQGVELLRNGRAVLRAIFAAPLPTADTP